jgi:hypothetical protein
MRVLRGTDLRRIHQARDGVPVLYWSLVQKHVTMGIHRLRKKAAIGDAPPKGAVPSFAVHSKLARYLRIPAPRQWLSFAMAGCLRAMLLITMLALLSADGLIPQVTVQPVVVEPPSLAEVDTAIARSESYINNLYKPIDDETATMAEYYGFPLRVYLSGSNRWVLAGESESKGCSTGVASLCSFGTEIYGQINRYNSETFYIDFQSLKYQATPKVRVDIDWDYDAHSYRATITNERFDDPSTTAQIYLYDVYIDTYSQANVGKRSTLILDKADRQHLHTFRYTIRHGNQEGQNYYWYKGDTERFAKLATFAARAGFRLDYDVRAPIWGYGASYSDDMPYHIEGSDGEDVYHDCQVTSTTNNLNYPYQSKICVVGSSTYVFLSRSDTLTPVIQALHMLNKYNDPNRSPSDGGNHGSTPLNTAITLEQTFNQSGFGIPMCSVMGCNYHLASGIRTFGFGALETLLGYRYGRGSSRLYADSVARIVLQTQIHDDGIVRTVAEGDYYRPAEIGAFYLSWDRSFKYQVNKPFGYRQIDSALNMPAEYQGVVVSNMETTMDAYAFLKLYRCQKYAVGCAAGLPKPTTPPKVQIEASRTIPILPIGGWGAIITMVIMSGTILRRTHPGTRLIGNTVQLTDASIVGADTSLMPYSSAATEIPLTMIARQIQQETVRMRHLLDHDIEVVDRWLSS